MAKQLAICSNVSYGMRDMSTPAFWFGVSFGEDLSSGALIILSQEEMAKAVEDAGIYDVTRINNRACQVDIDGNVVKFVKFLKDSV